VIKRKQRIALRDLAAMPAEDRAIVEKNAMNGQVFNVFKVLAHHPQLVKRWTPFAGHVLSKQSLPFRDRELLILRIGWLNQAEYELARHELIAKRGGLSDADIARLKEGPKAKGWSEHEAALLQLADDLHENSVVSDAAWATLAKKYSTEQLMDAVFTVGQYNLVSWALNPLACRLMTSYRRAGLRLASKRKRERASSVELYVVGGRKGVDNGDLPAVIGLPEIVGACRGLHDSAVLGHPLG